MTMSDSEGSTYNRSKPTGTDREVIEAYEKGKYRTFRASSRLDGVELSEQEPTESLSDIIARLKQPNQP